MLRQSIGAVIRHPGIWIEAVKAARSTASGRGLSPNPEYLAWRTETAYGSSKAAMPPHDLVQYLRWRRRQRTFGR